MGKGKRQLLSKGEPPEHPQLLLVGSQVPAHLGTIPTPPLGATPLKWHLLSSSPLSQSQTLWKSTSEPSQQQQWLGSSSHVELRPHSPSSRRTNPEFTKLSPSSVSNEPPSFMIPKHRRRAFNNLLSLPNNRELQDNFLFSAPPASLKRTSEPTGPAYQGISMHLNEKAIKHFNKVRGCRKETIKVSSGRSYILPLLWLRKLLFSNLGDDHSTHQLTELRGSTGGHRTSPKTSSSSLFPIVWQ